MNNKHKRLRIILTDKCTQNCTFCSKDFNKTKEVFAPLDKLKETIQEFHKLNGYEILISGGEPLLYPHLEELVDFIKVLNIKVQITTNGTLIKNNLSLLKKFDAIHISINSINKTSYNKISQPKANHLFEQLQEGLSILLKENINFKINTIYLTKYEKELLEILNFGKNNHVVIRIMNNMLEDEIYLKEYIKFVENITTNYPNVEFRTTTNPLLGKCDNCKYKLNCASSRIIWLFPDGTITPCPRNEEVYHQSGTLSERLTNSCKILEK